MQPTQRSRLNHHTKRRAKSRQQKSRQTLRQMHLESLESRELLALVGHYSLDSTLNDDSGNNNNGTFQGPGGANEGATYSADLRFGSVLNFDGTDDRVDLGPLFTMQNNSWSISMWVKTPSTGDTVPLIGKNSGDTGFGAGERVFEITGNQTWGNIINPEPAGNFAVNGHSLGGQTTNQGDCVSCRRRLDPHRNGPTTILQWE